MKTKIISTIVALASLVVTASAEVQDSPSEAAVRHASGKFVKFFNAKNADALKYIYRFDGSLKLPNAPAVNGRRAIRDAWAGGLAGPLGGLKLNITNLDDVGFNKVVESGTYELEINGPDGTPVGVQTGTYSVMWQYRWTRRGIKARILFDAIDAQAGPGA